MFKKIYRLYCDNCKSYIRQWRTGKPNITDIRKYAKVIYINGKPIIICERCFNELNNK